MGYNINFELKIQRFIPEPESRKDFRISKLSEEEFNDICDALEDMNIWDNVGDIYDDGWWFASMYGGWRQWENDMLELSKKFPKFLFTLFGEGEDAYDLWCAYFVNGAVQNAPAKITYDAFDPERLDYITKETLDQNESEVL